MRPDMSKVIHDHPRAFSGDHDYTRGRKANIPLEDLPAKESMQKPWHFYGQYIKEHTYVSGPLRGWLRKQVGRRWDDVYSEMVKNLPWKSFWDGHDHARHLVVTEVEMVNGVPYYTSGRWHQSPIESYGHWHQFYVNPDNGLLQQAPHSRRKKYKPNYPEHVWQDDTTVFMPINDIWYEVKVKPFEERRDRGVYQFRRQLDPVLLKPFYRNSDVMGAYGRQVIGLSKKQLSSRRIKQLGLRNHSS